MNELLQKYKEKLIVYWQQLNKGQKTKLILIVVFLLASLVLFTILATRTKYELAYVGVDRTTANTIVTKLDEMGISYQLSAGGSNISVPETDVEKVQVALASEIDPSGGNIYSKFWEQASFGMTDDQFKILERGAIEEKLRGLIRSIEGISDANVMITLPDQKVFYAQEQDTATASVIVKTAPGVELSSNQIKTIYNLIAMSVPDLPIENITLTNQYGQTLEYIEQGSTDYSVFTQQYQIEQEFQRNLERDLENMLRMIMGYDKASVLVQANMNFDQERTISNIVEPVIDGKGIERSVEKIQESFYGDGGSQGGVPGTGDSQIPGYPSTNSDNGYYEHIEERINYEVNEITKEVISSPYRLEDLGIIIAVDLPKDDENTEETIEAIKTLVRPVVSAALDEEKVNVDDRISVVAREFNNDSSIFDQNRSYDPMLLYGAIALSVLAIGGFSLSLVRRNRRRREALETEFTDVGKPEFDFSPALTEDAILQQEIQKLSKQKPEEFVQLLRTWISED